MEKEGRGGNRKKREGKEKGRGGKDGEREQKGNGRGKGEEYGNRCKNELRLEK